MLKAVVRYNDYNIHTYDRITFIQQINYCRYYGFQLSWRSFGTRLVEYTYFHIWLLRSYGAEGHPETLCSVENHYRDAYKSTND